MIRSLILHGADQTYTDIAYRSSLHLSAQAGRCHNFLQLTKDLEPNDVPEDLEFINGRSSGDVTPLMLAVRSGSASTVLVLLQKCANPHLQDSLQQTALDYLHLYDQASLEIMEHLLCFE